MHAHQYTYKQRYEKHRKFEIQSTRKASDFCDVSSNDNLGL